MDRDHACQKYKLIVCSCLLKRVLFCFLFNQTLVANHSLTKFRKNVKTKCNSDSECYCKGYTSLNKRQILFAFAFTIYNTVTSRESTHLLQLRILEFSKTKEIIIWKTFSNVNLLYVLNYYNFKFDFFLQENIGF